MKLTINIDGGCRGNPGPGSSAVVVRDETGLIIRREGRYLGPVTTNNKAEFTALYVALGTAAEMGGTTLDIRSDSQLLVKQYSGEYRIKNPDLAALMAEIHARARHFAKVNLTHVRREFNKDADALANKVLDTAASLPVYDPAADRGMKSVKPQAAAKPARLSPAAIEPATKPEHKARREKKRAPENNDGPEQLTLF